ncbi:hypothetical protein [Clostridium perfringens]|uniref:hypothetical protein n=1 Tax=Clostridium perfringens TaxID=1502 RepID=UPI0022481DDD|nr:hypothetical protein [Clostridium perfringens]MCX0381884.1 hypothetical protein [Clostridium perfringens]
MFKVSEAFNKEINKLQGRKFNAKVIIRDKEYSGNQIYEMNLEESVNPSDSFSIGSICSNSFDIKLINTGDIFDNAIVKPYVGLYIGDDIEYIPLGVFTVIKTSVKGKFINLECVDNMLGLEKVYFSDLSYPADINDIAKEICKKAGVNLASKLPNYRVNKIEGYSLREAIGFIASLCGSFARFNRIGDLEVRDYEVVKQEMTPHNLFKLDIEANECIIKKVIAKKGEEELSTGTDDGNKIVFNNPIITKEILSDIYTKYNGFKYIPYTAKWKGNPAIMAGDILNLTDLNGNKYNALIMEQKFTYKNGISSEVKAKGKTRQDSSFDNKGSVAQSMERYSIEQANIKKALIDKASINDLTAVDAKIQRLYTEDLTTIRADIVTLNSQKANIIELNSVRADLQQAIIGKANITDLNAAVGKINVLESKTASIENALNKNLTAENIATGAITAGSGIIAEGAIGDAEISSLSVNKLKVGDITTSKHRIVSADGTIEIVGNQILINRNNVNRVILGEYRKIDSTTDYGLLIRGKDGKTIMLDSDGVHNAGITNGAIDNNKVADNANISGNKLDINSVIREVNNNGTETIKGTKVTVGDRTLDVELSTQNNTITEHSKELSSQKTSINALDNALKLKVDEQVYRDSINTINDNISNTNSNLSKATTELNLLKGEVGSKVNKTDIDKTVKEIEDKIKINTDKISTAESSFIQKTNEIKANVSNLESETTTKIINAKNEAIKESRSIPDTRNDNQPPSWYMKTYPNQTITEFKYSDIVQILGSKVFGTLETKVPWDNSSGGYPTQIFRSNSTATFQRHGISETDWSDWEQIENTKGSQEKANGALENSKDYTNSQITVVNTKVYNLESGIDILKDQIKSKVSQSDIDKSITTVDNKIKLVDSKISDVSSSVIQLKDSVETSINSINSKTQSLETSLNGKVSKQELTVVDNKVANIKASLDGITQRVSSTESKTQTLEHNINDKASKQEVVNLNSKVVDITANLNGITQRVSSTETFTKSLNDKLWETTNKLNNVEQRITPTSIINMVSSSYYQKGEANNLFSTKSEVEQLDNRVNYRFSNTGYSNLIFNGNFANGTVHWRNWGNCSLTVENGQLLVRAKQSAEKANMGAVSSTFVLEKGKKYSLSFQGASCWNIPWLNYIYLLGEDGVNYRLDLNININSADLVYRTATFTAPETKWVRLLIGIEGYLQTDISGFKLVDVCLVEGDIPRRFIPNANEISEGSTSIDSNGVIVRHSNDSYTSMTHGGFEWKTKGMSKAYHCLAETGWVNISTGAWLGDHYDIKITLPEYFRGKVFTPCSMIQGWYVESNFSLNQLVVNIPYETINYSEGSFVIRVKALTRDGVFQRNINISWLAIA